MPSLSWSCSDPEGDPLRYDVYFGTNSSPTTIISSDQTARNFTPGGLNNITSYFWQVVAKDNKGNITIGPIWNFTTISNSQINWTKLQNVLIGRCSGELVSSGNNLFFLGGDAVGTASSNFFHIYDINSNTWERGNDMIYGDRDFAATVLNNKIYVFGGDSWNGGQYRVQIYDIALKSWNVETNPIPSYKRFHRAVTESNRIFIIGGGNNDPTEPSCYEYLIDSKTFVARSSMITPRNNCGLASLNGKLYAIGGDLTLSFAPTNIVEEYDIATDKWTRKADMPIAMRSARCVTIGDKLYVIGATGAYGEIIFRDVYSYNPNTDSWTTSDPNPYYDTYNRYPGVTSSGNSIFVVGGGNASEEVKTFVRGTMVH